MRPIGLISPTSASAIGRCVRRAAGTFFSYSDLLDSLDPTKIGISFGDYPEHNAGQFGVRGNAPLPENVSVQTGAVKYELIDMGLLDGLRPKAPRA